MQTYLNRLEPGTRFRLSGMPEITGEFLRCSESSCTVRLDRGVRDIEFEGAGGTVRTFRTRRCHITTWALGTVVEPTPPCMTSTPTCGNALAVKCRSRSTPFGRPRRTRS